MVALMHWRITALLKVIALKKQRVFWGEMTELWCTLLFEYGFHGTQERAVVLAEFALSNGFSKPLQLRETDHPGSWPGAEELRSDEIRFMAELKNMKRPCIRWIHLKHRCAYFHYCISLGKTHRQWLGRSKKGRCWSWGSLPGTWSSRGWDRVTH